MAAANREDAKRLGLLNEDEMDSDQEDTDKNANDDGEDEALLLDKMLKDRFLHRSSVDLEERFSDDDDEGEDEQGVDLGAENEERQQERLAKRFEKRARMQRLIDSYGHEEEFSQSRLIDDDADMKIDLLKMKVSGIF